MSDTMPRARRTNSTRPILPEDIQKVVNALREQGEARHAENQDRFRGIQNELHELRTQFTDHARADREGMDSIKKAIEANTAITMQYGADTREIVETWKGVNTMRRGLVWIAGLATSIAFIVGSIMYLMGKAPFPGLGWLG